MLSLLALCAFLRTDAQQALIPSNDELTPAIAQSLVTQFLRQGCDDDVANRVRFNTIACREVLPGDFASLVCYADTEIGVFVVSQGYVDLASVVFHRLD